MSEQNILNPTITSALNPDYSVKVTNPQIISRFQARSGKPFMRRLAARGEVFELTWQKRMFADYATLRQWFAQYENDFFTYADYDLNRYYSGMFADQPQAERANNNQVNISAQFIAVPTLPLYQYPSNWNQDAIFMEERNNFPVSSGLAPTVNDLVKLTGTWDRLDKNYVLWSEDATQAVWNKKTGVTVTQVSDTDPRDGVSAITASRVVYDGTGLSGDDRVYQFVNILGTGITLPGVPYTAEVWMRTESGTATLIFGGSTLIAALTCNLTTSWQRFTVTAIGDGVHALAIEIQGSGNAAFTLRTFGWQLEVGSAASTYAKTTSTTAYLRAPSVISSFHGGYAYFDVGNVTSDAAEWRYFGYGVRVWAPKAPWMGIMQVWLDGVLQGTVDLYAAALTASAAVFTITNVALGDHRLKLMPTNTKNGSSSAVIVCADALQVMR